MSFVASSPTSPVAWREESISMSPPPPLAWPMLPPRACRSIELAKITASSVMLPAPSRPSMIEPAHVTSDTSLWVESTILRRRSPAISLT